jgi:hypothetical protein
MLHNTTYRQREPIEVVIVQGGANADASRGVAPMFSSYEQLLTMLSQGWEIEPPVYVRPRWHSRSGSEKGSAYHFVLWDDHKVKLVSVRDCPEVQRFLAENGMDIDRL